MIEVRCGQQTRNFFKFPYTEVERELETEKLKIKTEKLNGEVKIKTLKTETEK